MSEHVIILATKKCHGSARYVSWMFGNVIITRVCSLTSAKIQKHTLSYPKTFCFYGFVLGFPTPNAPRLWTEQVTRHLFQIRGVGSTSQLGGLADWCLRSETMGKYTQLVGGFNPSEKKYESNWKNLPQFSGWKSKMFELPPHWQRLPWLANLIPPCHHSIRFTRGSASLLRVTRRCRAKVKADRPTSATKEKGHSWSKSMISKWTICIDTFTLSYYVLIPWVFVCFMDV